MQPQDESTTNDAPRHRSRSRMSLTTLISIMVVSVELAVLTILGSVYLQRFYHQMESRLETQARLPGELMNAGLSEDARLPASWWD